MITELFLITCTVSYIVDVSGWTSHWKKAFSAYLTGGPGTDDWSIKPFDCSLCMTFWSCLIYAFCVNKLTLDAILFTCLMSLLSMPIAFAWSLLGDIVTAFLRFIQNQINRI